MFLFRLLYDAIFSPRMFGDEVLLVMEVGTVFPQLWDVEQTATKGPLALLCLETQN